MFFLAPSLRVNQPEPPHQHASQIYFHDDVTAQNINCDDFNLNLNDYQCDLSEDEDESDSETETENCLEEELVVWAKQFIISTTAMDALLKLLKIRGHPLLPKSSKTLYHTPVTRDLIVVEPGKYFHFGFEVALKIELLRLPEKTIIPSTLEIDFNVDGIPISKSSGSQFWPVLALIKNIKAQMSPFVIGLYHGLTKPASASDFLKRFAEETKELMSNGFIFKGVEYKIAPRSYICDAPAKSFILGTKGTFFYYFLNFSYLYKIFRQKAEFRILKAE